MTAAAGASGSNSSDGLKTSLMQQQQRSYDGTDADLDTKQQDIESQQIVIVQDAKTKRRMVVVITINAAANIIAISTLAAAALKAYNGCDMSIGVGQADDQGFYDTKFTDCGRQINELLTVGGVFSSLANFSGVAVAYLGWKLADRAKLSVKVLMTVSGLNALTGFLGVGLLGGAAGLTPSCYASRIMQGSWDSAGNMVTRFTSCGAKIYGLAKAGAAFSSISGAIAGITGGVGWWKRAEGTPTT